MSGIKIINTNIFGVGGGMNAELLWTNPSPYLDFNKQSLTIGTMGEYDYLLVISKQDSYSNVEYQSIIELQRKTAVPSTSNYALSPIISQRIDNYNWVTVGRKLYVSSDFTVLYIDNSNTLGLNDQNNSYNIPIKVYGIKGKIDGIN